MDNEITRFKAIIGFVPPGYELIRAGRAERCDDSIKGVLYVAHKAGDSDLNVFIADCN